MIQNKLNVEIGIVRQKKTSEAGPQYPILVHSQKRKKICVDKWGSPKTDKWGTQYF